MMKIRWRAGNPARSRLLAALQVQQLTVIFDRANGRRITAGTNSFYRVSHGSRSASPGVFDPDIKKLSRQDWNGVQGRLNQIVRSFRFLR